MSLHQVKIAGNSDEIIIITQQEPTSCKIVLPILKIFWDIISGKCSTPTIQFVLLSLGKYLGENLNCFWLFSFFFYTHSLNKRLKSN